MGVWFTLTHAPRRCTTGICAQKAKPCSSAPHPAALATEHTCLEFYLSPQAPFLRVHSEAFEKQPEKTFEESTVLFPIAPVSISKLGMGGLLHGSLPPNLSDLGPPSP